VLEDVDILIPMLPAKAERKEPTRKEMEILMSKYVNIRAKRKTKTPRDLYSSLRNVWAPFWIKFEIFTIFSVPLSSFFILRKRKTTKRKPRVQASKTNSKI